MSIIVNDLSEALKQYSTSATPTKSSAMQSFMINQNTALQAVATLLNSYEHINLQKLTAYTVGQIVYSPNLPSNLYLVCITAGTTGATEPDFTNISGDYITDGSSQFIVVDSLDTTPVGRVVYDTYLRPRAVKANGATVLRADYPRLAAWADTNSLWTDSPSTEVGKIGRGNGSTTMVLPNYLGRVIQGAESSIGSKLNAGLPNAAFSLTMHGAGSATALQSVFGNVAHSSEQNAFLSGTRLTGSTSIDGFEFNLKYANAIYGNSDTVQPPAISLIPQIYY